ncbi:MAG TPA: metallopeptidase family protein [Thermomicrobiales bacterium]|nr:metallopeptidase family protein [Thermomicrobiales bacterium]
MRDVRAYRLGRIRRKQFERLVARVLDGLPADIRALLDNVSVVVQDEPAADQVSDPDETLFGLYEGVPRTERGGDYSMTLPDKITIFRGPIERACASPEEMAAEVRITVIHELGHHLGLDEDRLTELGWQ